MQRAPAIRSRDLDAASHSKALIARRELSASFNAVIFNPSADANFLFVRTS